MRSKESRLLGEISILRYTDAAAAAESLQSCLTLCDPHRWQPTRLPCPWDSPGKNIGVGYHFLLQCMKVKSESEVTQSCPTLSDPMDCSLPGSSIHGIFQARVLEWGAIAFSGYTDDTTIMAKSEEKPKRLLITVKEESEKAGLKFEIKKIKMMISGPTTSQQINGETMERVADFFFLGL